MSTRKEMSDKKLVIFDLDDTLCHEGTGVYKDKVLSKEAKVVLDYLQKEGHLLAVASHNTEAVRMVKELGISQFFFKIVGYRPKSYKKMPLVEEILKETNMSKDDVVFFDDLYENVSELKRKGIKARIVNWQTGVTKNDLLEMSL